MHHFDENLFYYNCENKMSVSGGEASGWGKLRGFGGVGGREGE